MKRCKKRSGFTLIEILVIVAIIGVAAMLAVPSISAMNTNARLRNAAMDTSGALNYARSEAIRTGNIHILFFSEDAEGNSLKDKNGDDVPILILDDGRPGSANQDCKITAGEAVVTVSGQSDVSAGVTSGTVAAPEDGGGGDITTGSSFTDPGGNDATWVLFRPEGSPRSFDSSCVVGVLGSGAGSFYMQNGRRSAAVVMTPMGGIRIHSWDGGQWTQ